MKVWHGYGSEHSANLVIIGHFKTAADAQAAGDLIDTAMGIAMEDERAGRIVPGKQPSEFSKDMLALLSEHSLPFTYSDAESLIYDHTVEVDGSDVVVTTEDIVVGGLINILVDKGARIEMYSAHMHESPYGRQTYEGD